MQDTMQGKDLIRGNFTGVGGLIFHRERYLLVKQAYGEYRGLWILPGGHVKDGEALHRAAEREVWEEANIRAAAEGIVAVRSRIRNPQTTDCYLVFQMRYIEGMPRPDGEEVDAAEFLRYGEIEALNNVVNLTKIIVQQHNAKKLITLNRAKTFEFYNSNDQDYQLFL